MKNWKPIELNALNDIILDAEQKLSPELMEIWEQVRIEPEKWSEASRGSQGGGFWVVAVMQDEVVWYNDLEDGFEMSRYTRAGVIDEYWNDCCELHHLLWHLLQ